MLYVIYKTTNTLDGKFYIGKHQTKTLDDSYIGSGKLLLKAVEKYGIENFVTEIVLLCVSAKQMNLAERILVVPDSETNYNLCPGGGGGWAYLKSIKNYGGWKLTTYSLSCKNCNKRFEKRTARTVPTAKFCSKRCAGQFYAKQRVLTPETKKKISATVSIYHASKRSLRLGEQDAGFSNRKVGIVPQRLHH